MDDDICGYLRQQTRPNTTDNTNENNNAIDDDDGHNNDDDDDDERQRDENAENNRQPQLVDNLFWLDMARDKHLWSRLEDGYVKR